MFGDNYLLNENLTVTSSMICSLSFLQEQACARYFRTLVEGGVVKSKNRVNISLTETVGNLSCLSHVFTDPKICYTIVKYEFSF